MDTSPTFDLAVPVRYTLTHRAAADDCVDLVLDLFRGAVQIHTRTIASVDREQAVLVMAKCRRYLQLRGVDAAPTAPAAPKPPSVMPAPPRPAPTRSLSVTANPAVAPMRPVTGVKPMVVPARPVEPKPLSAKPAPAMPAAAKPAAAKPGVLAARTAAARLGSARQDRAQDARVTAPAAAAFDWMFEAV